MRVSKNRHPQNRPNLHYSNSHIVTWNFWVRQPPFPVMIGWMRPSLKKILPTPKTGPNGRNSTRIGPNSLDWGLKALRYLLSRGLLSTPSCDRLRPREPSQRVHHHLHAGRKGFDFCSCFDLLGNSMVQNTFLAAWARDLGHARKTHEAKDPASASTP